MLTFHRLTATTWAFIMSQTELSLVQALAQQIFTQSAIPVQIVISYLPEVTTDPLELLALNAITLADLEGQPGVYQSVAMPQLPPSTKRVTQLLIAYMQQLIQLGKQMQEIELQALSDPITGLPNSRSLHQMLPRYLERATRDHLSFTLLLIDGDSLKDYNSQLGYEAGNTWIRNVALALQTNLRPGDYIARWFVGDEFVVLLPNTNQQTALDIAERLRIAVQNTGQQISGFGTISIGVAEANEGITANVLLEKAQNALMQAKDHGKNRIALAGHPTIIPSERITNIKAEQI